MATIKGNTSSTYNASAFTNPSKIISFSLCNKSGGSVTASVGIFYGSTITYILYNKSISTADTYVYTGQPIILPANYQIYISVSGSTDYYFSIEGF